MAYLAARDLQFAKPVSSFITGRDNARQNALVEQQAMEQQAAREDQRQNALFQQQRLTAADQQAAQDRAAAAQENDTKKLFTAFQYLNSVASNPEAFQSTAQRILQHPELGRILQANGVTPEDMTPQNVQELLAATGANIGQGPAPTYETKSGPRGSILQTDSTGKTTQVVAPDNSQPAAAGSYRALTPSEIQQVGLPQGTSAQVGADGKISVISKPDTRSGGGGGLPIGALRLVDDAKQAINASEQSLTLIDRAAQIIKAGKVNLGMFNNAVARGRNIAGASSDASRAFTDVNQTFEKIRNNYLLLAKGVQTEGDAQRAWNSEIGENVQNDNRLALQQLAKAKGLIDQMVSMQQGRIETVYANYGATPPQQAVNSGAPVSVTSPAEAAKLPSGTRFVTPDGQVRVKR